MEILTAGDIKDYLEQVQRLSLRDPAFIWWYRGVGNSAHSLVPSLYRSLKPEVELLAIQQELITEFQAKSLLMDHGSSGNEQAWQSLIHMQHYGIPTYMLDWSTSPLIALYFALSSCIATGTTSPCRVFCLKPESWNREKQPSFRSEILRPLSRLDDYALAPSRVNGDSPIAFLPPHSNPRVQRQQGVFVVFGKYKNTMESIDAADNIVAIDIPEDAVPNLFSTLLLLGVSATSVYPDLHGLSLEMRYKYGI